LKKSDSVVAYIGGFCTNYIIFRNAEIFKKKISERDLFLRDNEESLKYFGMFYFSNWNLQN
jgi:hypothetical protein